MQAIAPGERFSALILLFGLAGLTVYWAILLRDTFHGDPTIYLSFAKHTIKGGFLTFNPGEFSGGCTSPVWALILSAGYIFADGVAAAKIIGCVFVIIALLVTYGALRTITDSPLASALGTALVLSFLAGPGLLLYESALAVLLVALILRYGYLCVTTSEDGQPRYLARFSLAAAALPLVRPDGVVLTVLGFALVVLATRRTGAGLRRAVGLFALSLLPTVAYYVYSYAMTGMFSTSGYCRAFALQEGARTFGGVAYSSATIGLLAHWPVSLWTLLALGAFPLARRGASLRWTLGFAASGAVAYVIVLSVVWPVDEGVSRYLLPVAPCIALLSAITLGRLDATARRRGLGVVSTLLAAVVAVYTLKPTHGSILHERDRQLTFDLITERDIIRQINEFAPPGAKILAYEVQDRYYLRPDLRILSLDGITDGKVAPYLSSGDMTAFLLRYRPDYWLANDAVHYRPYLAQSILRRAVAEAGEEEKMVFEADGIRFINLRIRRSKLPAAFAGYTQLFMLQYTQPAQ